MKRQIINALIAGHVFCFWNASESGAVVGGDVEANAIPAGPDIYVYDANLGTFPGAQGFEVVEEVLGMAAVVTNGVLHTFETIPPNGRQFYRQTNAPLDFSTTAYLMEATLRIVSANYTIIGDGNQRSGYYLEASDNSARHFWIGLSSDGIVINTDNGLSPNQGVTFRPFNTTDTFHTYRFVIDRGLGTLFIDGTEFASLPVGQTGVSQLYPSVAFGDYSGRGVSEAELRHFRFASLAPRLSIEVSEVRLCWNSLSHRTYQIQYRSPLDASSWIDLGEPIQGNGTVNCVTDPVVGSRRFYQIVVRP